MRCERVTICSGTPHRPRAKREVPEGAVRTALKRHCPRIVRRHGSLSTIPRILSATRYTVPMAAFPPLPPCTPDPIFRIAAEARKAGPRALDGTIGMFMDEDGTVLTFGGVRK